MRCPVTLDFVQEPEQTAGFLENIRKDVAARSRTDVLVDLRPLTTVTPAAALALIAGMVRAKELSPKVNIRICRPDEPAASSLLQQVGFYDYSDAR